MDEQWLGRAQCWCRAEHRSKGCSLAGGRCCLQPLAPPGLQVLPFLWNFLWRSSSGLSPIHQSGLTLEDG